MGSDIEFLEHIFDQMKEAGLVETKGEFSQSLLGKSASYLTSMAARDRTVPTEVLDYMSLRLLDRAERSATEISEMDAKLCGARARADREADICEQFEAFRRRKPTMGLGGGGESVNAYPALQSSAWRFAGMMLRRVGMNMTVRGEAKQSAQSTSATYRTLH